MSEDDVSVTHKTFISCLPRAQQEIKQIVRPTGWAWQPRDMSKISICQTVQAAATAASRGVKKIPGGFYNVLCSFSKYTVKSTAKLCCHLSCWLLLLADSISGRETLKQKFSFKNTFSVS